LARAAAAAATTPAAPAKTKTARAEKREVPHSRGLFYPALLLVGELDVLFHRLAVHHRHFVLDLGHRFELGLDVFVLGVFGHGGFDRRFLGRRQVSPQLGQLVPGGFLDGRPIILGQDGVAAAPTHLGGGLESGGTEEARSRQCVGKDSGLHVMLFWSFCFAVVCIPT